MSEQKSGITPGPWRVEIGQDANEGQIFVEGDALTTKKQHICKLGYSFDKNGHDQRLANARAIAALPNLIEALRECITDENAAGMQQGLGRQKRRLQAISAIAHEALEKAGAL